MFIFSLFEKDSKKDDTLSKSLDAPTKALRARAYREVPGAKSDNEAMAGFLARQADELDREQSTNKDQAKQIRRLSRDAADKEKRFQDFNKKVADMPGLTAQDKARMAQEIEREIEKDLDLRAPADQMPATPQPAAVKQPAKPAVNPKTGTPTGPISRATTTTATPNIVAVPTAQAPAQAPADTTQAQPADTDAGKQAFAKMAQTVTAPTPTVDPNKLSHLQTKFSNVLASNEPAQAVAETTQPNPRKTGEDNVRKFIGALVKSQGNLPTYYFEFKPNDNRIIQLSQQDIIKLADVLDDFDNSASEKFVVTLADFDKTFNYFKGIKLNPKAIEQVQGELPFDRLQPGEQGELFQESNMKRLISTAQELVTYGEKAFVKNYGVSPYVWVADHWDVLKPYANQLPALRQYYSPAPDAHLFREALPAKNLSQLFAIKHRLAQPQQTTTEPVTTEPVPASQEQVPLATLQARDQKLEKIIDLKEKIEAYKQKLINRFGGLERGLAADLEIDYPTPQTDADYNDLLNLYAKQLQMLQNFEARKKNLYREDAWHAGDNAWSSEHDQWAKESVQENTERHNQFEPTLGHPPAELGSADVYYGRGFRAEKYGFLKGTTEWDEYRQGFEQGKELFGDRGEFGKSYTESIDGLLESIDENIAQRKAEIDRSGNKMYRAQEAYMVVHNGKEVAFYRPSEMKQAYNDAEGLAKKFGGEVRVQKVIRESYWNKLQRERDLAEHSKAYSMLDELNNILGNK